MVIKRWIPEPDQDILFEHTRSLREKRMIKETAVELKNERDNLRFGANSRPWMFDKDHPGSGPASDNEDALPERRGRGPPIATRGRKPHRNIPPSESSGATVTLTDGETSSSEDEHDESAEAAPTDKAGAMAAVNELLGKYTTLFERAA